MYFNLQRKRQKNVNTCMSLIEKGIYVKPLKYFYVLLSLEIVKLLKLLIFFQIFGSELLLLMFKIFFCHEK